MKERSAELIIRWWRQPAGQHKLTEVQYDTNSFNRAFSKCWFRKFDLAVARDRTGPQHYDVIDWSDYQREKSITISKHDFCDNNYRSKNDLHRILEVRISLPSKNG